ncbi:MAG: thrombospondin type 3 repeat-containing protein [Acidobacteriota bacterium]|nr:thrombospondin type 3 repeat-containing protein [Acidobacteriota bacterium]
MTHPWQRIPQTLGKMAFRLGVAVLLTLVLAAGPAYAGPTAYIASGSNVLGFDAATNTVTGTVSGTGIRVLTVNADGSRVYSTDFSGISVIDTATNTIIGTVSTGFLPVGIALSPDEAFAYVANNASGTVSVVDTSTLTVVQTFSGVANSSIGGSAADGSIWVGVGSLSGASITVIDTATNTITASFATGHGVNGAADIVFSADGSLAFVANSDNTVSVLDTGSYAEISSTAVGSLPYDLDLSPDGAYLAVANLLGNSVSVIDTSTASVVATVPVGTFPRTLAFTPDGEKLYVSNNDDDTLSVIDVMTWTVTTTVPGIPRPWGLVFLPDTDADDDGIEDDVDNCPFDANPDQADNDSDGAGDACDLDDDNDGVLDSSDNCPLTANSDQLDFDGDGLGDACDADGDGDGIDDGADICPFTPPGDVIDPGTGCSIAQLCPCEGPQGTSQSWKNHGQYVSCVAKTSNGFRKAGLITAQQRSAIVSAAAQSSCGR